MQKVLWSVENVLLPIMIIWLWENYLDVLQTRGVPPNNSIDE